jgi:UDP-N-acetylglucosamine diphosphorylase/glucosamine-1-phosphate N-acetyltransferase
MLPFLVVDDAHPRLGPLTDLRPAFDVRTGALTTLERLERTLGGPAAGLCVPAALAELVRETHGVAVNTAPAVPASADRVLVVNGRWVVPDARAVVGLAPGAVLVEAGSGEPVAGTLPVAAATALMGDPRALLDAVAAAGATRQSTAAAVLLDRPWRVRTFRDGAIDADLELLVGTASRASRPGVTIIGDPANVRLHPDATISPTAVIDVEKGRVVVDAGATIRPGAIVVGPACVGRNSTVLERTLVKAHTAIGPWCKVAGEVGGTIFQGFANKAHDGHLGDAWIGEWANLGAGTTNSNLLNTYAEIVARSGTNAPSERTGETFLGPVIGDHAKFAICTRLMAGSVVGTGVMWAASAPVSGPVEAFSWVTDDGKRRYRLDKFVEVARAVMARRKMEPTAAYLRRLGELHAAGVQA